MTGVSALTVFHRAADPQRFATWAQQLLASAHAVDGCIESRVSVHSEVELDWAVEVSFGSADRLDDWLDSRQRRRLLADGEALGHWRRCADMVLAEDGLPPDGTAVLMQTVAPGKEGDFVAAQAAIAANSAAFPGYDGTIVFAPDSSGQWRSVLRFRTAQQLAAWMRSRERHDALPALQDSLTGNFSEVSRTAPFGSTVRTDFGRTRITPGWKTAMLVLLGLYPTVMVLSRFLGPALGHLGVAPWLTLFISNVASVGLLQWVLVPGLSRPFRRWLDPVDGADVQTSLAGATFIVVGYIAAMTLFALVKDLQFWN